MVRARPTGDGARPVSDWRKRMVAAYPELFTEIVGRELRISAQPYVGDGWEDTLARAVVRFEAAKASSPGAKITILQIKEKFGGLRIYLSTSGLSESAKQQVDRAVFLAECRAACTCETCGERGRLWSGDGWLVTSCDAHGRGEPLVRDRPEDQVVECVWRTDQWIETRYRYVRERDELVPLAIEPDNS
jgi:hypothetical protein